MKKILIYILCFISFSTYLQAQTTAIPDTAFEQRLIALGIDSDGLVNGQILNSDAVGVTALDISNSGITSLSGINIFADLMDLNCSGNAITYLSLSYKPYVTIDCSNNTGFVSLNLENCFALTHLDCSNSNYSSINTVNCTALVEVDCSGNRISNLDFSVSTSLAKLNCSGNNLNTLNVTNCNVLTDLYCGGNTLSSLNLSTNTALVRLSCGSNGPLSTLDVTNCTALTYLNCGFGTLSSLDVSNSTNLDTLICGVNNLTSLDVSSNINLKHLNCFVNNLTNLNLSNNINLRALNCEANNLSSLDVSNCTALEGLSCANNQLTNINLANNSALRWLDCNHNNLTSIDISNNPNLEYVDCNHNNISNANVSNNPLIYTLAFSNNNLSSLDISSCTGLTGLQCQSNNLSNLDLSNNLDLRTVYAYSNNLTSIDLTNNVRLLDFYLDNNNLTSLDVTNNPDLENFSCSGNNLISLNLMSNDSLISVGCRNNAPNLRICLTTLQILNNSVFLVKDPTADISENCVPLSVEGQVVIDDNLNCLKDSSEQGLRGQWIKFRRTTDAAIKYAFVEDSLGNYQAYLDTGTYVVTVIPSGSYWKSCPDSQIVVIDTNYVVQRLDWTLQPLVSCPNLQVDIAAPFLRMTGGGSAYTVSYCNVGSIPAQGAYVEVDIDAYLNVTSSTLPIASQVGTVYTFNLGTVGIGACGSFNIQVVLDTSAQFQQTHCTEAHIYPDSICTPTWTGPRVDGFASCQSTQINFVVENRGAAMLSPQPYTIFEDNIAMRVGTVNLGAGQSTTVIQPAAVGKTYRIEVDQAPGFPALFGNLVFSSTIEGCNPFPNGSFNTGFVTQFSNGHSAPFLAIDCQQNVGSYDPNDKAAQPAGYGAPHYIDQNIDIDYKIRFQNTGTDTAFNVVILDTLSSHLDLTSLQMGASSHAYTWNVTGNVLKVSFPNILLVDSIANEPLSHGFFRYRIEQKVNNPIGTLIENQAAIYFDYNPPIFTNTTFHTVGEDFVPVVLSVEEVYVNELIVTAFPNPFNSMTTIKVEGATYESLELTVFDISGRVVAQEQNSQGAEIQFAKGNLQEGIYIYQLKGDGALLNTGKIMVR